MKKIRIEGEQFFMDGAGVEFRELKKRIVLDTDPPEDCVRVWSYQWPNTFAVQFRKWGRTTDGLKGKKRFTIATVHVSIEEMEKILAYMREQSRPISERISRGAK